MEETIRIPLSPFFLYFEQVTRNCESISEVQGPLPGMNVSEAIRRAQPLLVSDQEPCSTCLATLKSPMKLNEAF
jgi:hypothetical protein